MADQPSNEETAVQAAELMTQLGAARNQLQAARAALRDALAADDALTGQQRTEGGAAR
ncbi:hypothetical protein ACWGID_01665 [Kribbella sp. NPDC054772]